MKILVVHPGKQHSYQTALALYKNGNLYKFVTSVYNGKGTLTNILYMLSKGTIKKKIGGHNVPGIPQEKVMVRCEAMGIFSLVMMKIPFIKRYYGAYNQKLNDSFAKKVAKIAIEEQVDAVISYDNNSALLFEILAEKAPRIKRILDVSIATRPFMRETFLRDYQMTGEESLLKNYPDIMDESHLQRIYREIKNTDYFLAPSQIVRKSLIYCGAEDEQIRIIPYGADLTRFGFVPRTVHSEPLKLIFVGAVDHRKGIHHLLKVVSDMGDQVDVKLVGVYDTQGDIYQRYKNHENIHFCGFATHDILAGLYQESDVFVFPTLGEGFGMVVIEAMSCGLPVIISDVAGGNDAITDGVDGFEFEAGNDEQLRQKIQWFLDHKEQLPTMGINARETAEGYTWEKYHDTLNAAIASILKGE